MVSFFTVVSPVRSSTCLTMQSDWDKGVGGGGGVEWWGGGARHAFVLLSIVANTHSCLTDTHADRSECSIPLSIICSGWGGGLVGVWWKDEMRSPSVINALIPSHPPNDLRLLRALLLSRHTFWISAIVLLGLRNVPESAPRGVQPVPRLTYSTRLILFLFMLLFARKVWWPQEALLPWSMILIVLFVKVESEVFVL